MEMWMVRSIHIPFEHRHLEFCHKDRDELCGTRIAMYILHLLQVLDLLAGCIVSVFQALLRY